MTKKISRPSHAANVAERVRRAVTVSDPARGARMLELALKAVSAKMKGTAEREDMGATWVSRSKSIMGPANKEVSSRVPA